jgi:dynein heavy chain
MEGARWDMNTGSIADAKLKELYPPMPVVYLKAITQDKADLRYFDECISSVIFLQHDYLFLQKHV